MALCGPSGHNQQGPLGIFIVLCAYWALGFFLVFPRMENDMACLVFRVIHTIFGFGVLGSLIGVHIADPGILPVGEWNADTHAILRGPIAMQFKKIVDAVTNEEVELKFCTHCLIWRPARAAHCYTCDRCVARYDHHCPVLGACIAQRTYRFFLGVLAFASAGGLLLFIGSIWWLVVLHPRNIDVWHDWHPYIALLSLLSTLYLAGVTGFLCMHCFLLCEQKTTKEQFGRNGGGHRTCCLTSRRAWNEFCGVVICAPLTKRTIWGMAPTKIVHSTPMISHSISALIDVPREFKVTNADGTPIGSAASPAVATNNNNSNNNSVAITVAPSPPPIPPSGPYATATSGPVKSMGLHESLMLALMANSSSSSTTTDASPAISTTSSLPTTDTTHIAIANVSSDGSSSSNHHNHNTNNNANDDHMHMDDSDESRPLSSTPKIWHNNDRATDIPLSSVAISSSEPSSVTLHSGNNSMVNNTSTHMSAHVTSAAAMSSADTPEEPLLARVDRVV